MTIDIITVLVAAYGFYFGYSRGIIQTVATFFSYGFGLILAFKMTPTATELLERTFKTNNPLMFIAGFLLVFVLTMMFFRLVARGIEGMFDIARIGVVNQVAGGALTMAFYVLILSVLVWFGNQASLIDEQTKATSKTWPIHERYPAVAKTVAGRVAPIFKDFWHGSINMVDRLEKYGVQQTDSRTKVYDIEKPAAAEIERLPEE